MSDSVRPLEPTPGLYRHYKQNNYRVIGLARHSETREWLVVYEALYGDGGLWVRPAVMFTETVEVDGRRVPRFERVGDWHYSVRCLFPRATHPALRAPLLIEGIFAAWV